MITCSSAWLIKLCVVFTLNISWFTTGTAPPLRPQGENEIHLTTLSPTISPTPASSYATISRELSTTKFSNYESDHKITRESVQIKQKLSPTLTLSSKAYVNSNSTSFSNQPSSSSTTFTKKITNTPVGKSLEGTSPASLSKRFKELFTTISAPFAHTSTTVSKSGELKIDIIIGATSSTSDDNDGLATLSSIPEGRELGESKVSPIMSSKFEEDKRRQADATTLPSPSPVVLQTHIMPITMTELATPLSLNLVSKEQFQSTISTMSPDFEEPEYLNDEDSDPETESSLRIGIIFDKDYTPEEIAEYIFLTGDEEGVAMAINDLINDGLMLNKEEAINFLEAIQTHLTNLKDQYQAFLISSEKIESSSSAKEGETGSVSYSTGNSDVILLNRSADTSPNFS